LSQHHTFRSQHLQQLFKSWRIGDQTEEEEEEEEEEALRPLPSSEMGHYGIRDPENRINTT
jgi:hypothetical protein